MGKMLTQDAGTLEKPKTSDSVPVKKNSYEELFKQARTYIQEKELRSLSKMYLSTIKDEANAAYQALKWAQKDGEDLTFFVPFLRKRALEEDKGDASAANILGYYYVQKEGTADGTAKTLMQASIKKGKDNTVKGLQTGIMERLLDQQKKDGGS
ncbi:MAG: hypothetical protein Q7S22_06530 [Candidatus Micrarchaeota archaeon]|nr:hypothetical protein [Candidatus Micrarchaeota archaeon]